MRAYRGTDIELVNPSIEDNKVTFDDGGSLEVSPPEGQLTLFTDFYYDGSGEAPYLSGFENSDGTVGITHELKKDDEIVTKVFVPSGTEIVSSGVNASEMARNRVVTVLTLSGIEMYVNGESVPDIEYDLSEILPALTRYHLGKWGESSPLAGSVYFYALFYMYRTIAASQAKAASIVPKLLLKTADGELLVTADGESMQVVDL